jgi:hypothetical protein
MAREPVFHLSDVPNRLAVDTAPPKTVVTTLFAHLLTVAFLWTFSNGYIPESLSMVNLPADFSVNSETSDSSFLLV